LDYYLTKLVEFIDHNSFIKDIEFEKNKEKLSRIDSLVSDQFFRLFDFIEKKMCEKESKQKSIEVIENELRMKN